MATSFLLLAGAVFHVLTPLRVIVLSLVTLFAAGGLGPLSIGISLRLAGANAASGAGLYGCLQMLSGVLCSSAAGLFLDHQLGCGLVLFAGYAICAMKLLRSHRPGRKADPS